MTETETFWEAAARSAWGQYLTERERENLFRALALAPPTGDAMEVGCEGGRWSRYLVERRDNVICTDVNPEVLDICGRRLPQANCVLTQSEDQRFPADDQQLGLLLVYEVARVTNSPWFATEAARVVQPGGILVLSHHNRASIRGLAYRTIAILDRHRRMSSFYRGPSYVALRRALAGAGFDVVHDEGLAWAPFRRQSNSRLIPVAIRFESALGLRRLATASPLVLTIARRRVTQAESDSRHRG